MAVTMRDVAREAGVSSATVSFVVNNTKPVLPATRDRIEKAMSELGFRPNMVARALASRRTQIIALVSPFSESRASLALREFILGAARGASDAEHNLVVWPVDNDDVESLRDLVGQQLVDGVLLMAVQLDDPRIDTLNQTKTPFALIGRTRDVGDIPYVDIDFEATMAMAMDHLTELGHRDIVLVNSNHSNPGFEGLGPFVRSLNAYQAETERRGMRARVLETGQNVESGRIAARELLEMAPDATAVIVDDEMAATGLMAKLEAQGVVVPDDISVVSILGSADIAAMCNPPLTVVTVPGRELGRLGVDALVRRLDDRPQSERLLHVGELVVGESTAPPKRRGE